MKKMYYVSVFGDFNKTFNIEVRAKNCMHAARIAYVKTPIDLIGEPLEITVKNTEDIVIMVVDALEVVY